MTRLHVIAEGQTERKFVEKILTPHLAPSKRIIAAVPEYGGEKTRAGVSVTERIGLDVLRLRCSHFNGWIDKLESL